MVIFKNFILPVTEWCFILTLNFVFTYVYNFENIFKILKHDEGPVRPKHVMHLTLNTYLWISGVTDGFYSITVFLYLIIIGFADWSLKITQLYRRRVQ